MSVRNILVAKESRQLIALSEQEVIAVPLHRCHVAQSCGECVALQDPYCAWDFRTDSCRPFSYHEDQLQSVNIGFHSKCPIIETTSSAPTTPALVKSQEFLAPLEDESTSPPITECPNCQCDCTTQEEPSSSDVDDFVDLLDIYNQSDLSNGVFGDGNFTFNNVFLKVLIFSFQFLSTN